ncbi:MAG TPA: helix-turn-helix transcriptional regulator [Candidatus Saccharimonadales bacterium]|nr:helix-turn-helix transcriptional regulator [Candidatus Saccharimonadales bacterium]
MTPELMTQQNGEATQALSLTIVTLGEMAMMQHAANILQSEQTKPPARSLAVLDALTRNCQTAEQISQALAPAHSLSVHEIKDELTAAVDAYKADTPIQAADIALARGDIILRPQPTTDRPPLHLQFMLEDTASGLDKAAMAQKYRLDEASTDRWLGAIMSYYDNALNLPTALRRAREAGHWPGIHVPQHTLAGVALPYKPIISLSSEQKSILQKKSEGYRISSRGPTTEKTYMQHANAKLNSHHTASSVTKAILLNLVTIKYDKPGILLTPGEIPVACGIVLGLPNEEIADQLTRSKHTIKTHVGNMMPKLGAGTREQLARRLIETEYFVASGIPDQPRNAPYSIPTEFFNT